MVYVRKGNQKYDAWLHWDVTLRCNLKCSYCFLGKNICKQDFIKKGIVIAKDLLGKSRKDPRIYANIEPVNIKLFTRALNNTKKIFRVSFTGGEPFIVPNIIEACKTIASKHYLSFNTNLVSPLAEKFAVEINPDRILFIVASLHLRELERLKLQKRFISVFHLFQKAGIPIFAREVAYPELLPDINRYKSLYLKNRIEFEFEPFLGWYKGKKYPDAYTDLELKSFGINREDLKIFNGWKGKKCIAGYVAGCVTPEGKITRCPLINTSYGSVYEKISFPDQPISCPLEHCDCPLSEYDPYLSNKHLKIGSLLRKD